MKTSTTIADTLLFRDLRIADTFWQRLRGLLGCKALSSQSALLLIGCRAIHTIGMRFPIDVVFLDADGTVLSVSEQLAPNRHASDRRAEHTLEMRAGRANQLALGEGQRLSWSATCVHRKPNSAASCNYDRK